MNKIKKIYCKLLVLFKYKLIFRSFSFKSYMVKPLKLINASSIIVEEKVFINDFGWLMGNKNFEKTMVISEGTVIGHFAHIIALHSVIIEKNVLIADKVFITDCTHNYENINIPIIKQGVSILGDVVIGEGSWIGENVSILGSKVGKHCIIGANSVVKRDIPDYSIAVGVPAKVVKKYNFDTNMWEKV